MGTINQYRQHIIPVSKTGREALQILDALPESHSRTLFVVDGQKLVGSITYGDIRRGLLKYKEISDTVTHHMNSCFKCLKREEVKPDILAQFRLQEIWLLPVVNGSGEIIDIIDLKQTRTVIPAAALIMAGGRGERLRPLTDNLPKPMLHVGGKPILETNIDRLIRFGIKTFYISVRYLSEKIMEYFGDGSSKGINIKYITEQDALGTLGACALIDDLEHEQLLVMNSDILTNIDYEDFFNFFKSKEAQMCAASIPYHVQVPYGIMQSDGNDFVTALVEKPSYTYYANAGIYLINKSLIELIPKDTLYNATDLMTTLIEQKQKLVHYPILQYWLDIGKYEDYIRAQQDYLHINFDHS
jgi:dTDP-glucose pyrophosphorylase